MYRSYEAYSSTRKKNRTRKTIFIIIKYAAIIFLTFFIITHFFIASFSVNSISMRPLLEPNDKVFASPLLYGIKFPLVFKDFRGLEHLHRGDLVIVSPPFYPHESFFSKTFGPFISFFTFQKINFTRDSQGEQIQSFMIKRIIGLPGDRVYVKQYKAYIKPQGETSFKQEKDLLPHNYNINASSPVTNWPESFPFAGNMDEITLQKNEYLLLGDNRPYSNDSRAWGAVSADQIIGKAIFRYWPLSRFQQL